MNRKTLLSAAILGGLSALLACDNLAKEAAKPVAANAPPPMTAMLPPPALPTSKVSRLEFSENDFVENDRTRDPFRAFALGPAATSNVVRNQKPVILPEFAVDELKLTAIVMSGDYPRAMVIDPRGKGWVLKRGDYLGRAETVHVGGASGTDYQLNWRVDRVRRDDLVLLREDPAQPGIPPATKVIPLHPESEDKDDKMGRN
jgi:type IV pilus assembly protein PilP